MAQRPRVVTLCPVSSATTLILCAVSLTSVCLSFSLLLLQSRQINELRTEHMALKSQVTKSDITELAARCGVGYHLTYQCASAGPRIFLHLQALSSHSHDQGDCTDIKWTVAWSQGEGIQVSGETVTVVSEGPYFIYSQVLYKSTTWIMGHVITKRLNGTDTKLMKCVKTMPDNLSTAQNSCYTAGIFFLESGTVLELTIPRKSADLVLTPHSTFFGIFSL